MPPVLESDVVSSAEKRARVVEMRQKESEGKEMAEIGAKMMERGMDKAISARANAKAALKSLDKEDRQRMMQSEVKGQ